MSLLLRLSAYADQNPRFYYDDERVAALYALSMFGISSTIGFPLFDNFTVGFSPFAEYRNVSRLNGEIVLPGERWNRFGGEIFFLLDTIDNTVMPREGISWSLMADPATEDWNNLTMSLKTELEAYLSLGEKNIISPRIEGEVLLTGTKRDIEGTIAGGEAPVHGYYPQEIRGDIFWLTALRLRRRIASLPLVAGKGVHLQLAGNSAAVYADGSGPPTYYHGGSFGLVAETAVGEITVLVGINIDGRPVSYIGLRSMIPGLLSR